MTKQILNNSPDLERLQDEGYEVEVRGGYLLIHHVPYVNHDKQVKFGVLISELTLIDGIKTTRPSSHQMYFFGEFPCYQNGDEISGIGRQQKDLRLFEDIIGNYYFSNKPIDTDQYSDYYHKVSNYVAIISAPAKSIDKTITAQTFRRIPENEEDSPFQYPDTNASRASIAQLNRKFTNQKIAIIGLGGTGSYILDLVSKTAVSEIHLFDADVFILHNAFRAPGAATREQLSQAPLKVEYYKNIYSKIHKGIVAHNSYITIKNIEELKDISFVFISVDKNRARNEIMRGLLKQEIPFIDVGIGVEAVDDTLAGVTRFTVGTPAKNDHLAKRIHLSDDEDDEYATNIQISDLNCLNAALAVIKWKRMLGFYKDLGQEFHSTYTINSSELSNEDIAT